MSLCPILELLS